MGAFHKRNGPAVRHGAAPCVTIVTPTFSPESIGTPLYATDLANGLVERGWKVRVITAQPFYPRFKRYPGYGRARRRDHLGSIAIDRLPTIVPRHGKAKWRAINELNFLAQGLIRAPFRQADAVISISPGAPWVALIGRALTRSGGTHLSIVHDLQYGLAASLGMATGALEPLLRANERASLNRADRLLVLTDEMKDEAIRLGIVRPVETFPLWSTLPASNHAAAPCSNSVQYSGNFGEKQGVTILLDLAERLADSAPETRVLLRGEGPRFDSVRVEARLRGLTNIDFEEPVPQAELAQALSASPVHIVTQAPGSARYAMPSKVVNALACGRRVVAMCDDSSPLVRLAARLPGLSVVGQMDAGGFAHEVVRALDSTSGAAASEISDAASSHFSRQRALDRLELVLSGQLSQ